MTLLLVMFAPKKNVNHWIVASRTYEYIRNTNTKRPHFIPSIMTVGWNILFCISPPCRHIWNNEPECARFWGFFSWLTRQFEIRSHPKSESAHEIKRKYGFQFRTLSDLSRTRETFQLWLYHREFFWMTPWRSTYCFCLLMLIFLCVHCPARAAMTGSCWWTRWWLAALLPTISPRVLQMPRAGYPGAPLSISPVQPAVRTRVEKKIRSSSKLSLRSFICVSSLKKNFW